VQYTPRLSGASVRRTDERTRMIDPLLDWRSLARWGSCAGLLAGDRISPLPLPRFVQRWLCQACERHYLSTDPEAQPCPQCGRILGYVARWDLLSEYSPRWWADPGAKETP
jgi:hypothetical protein